MERDEQLANQLVNETYCMVQYALEQGLTIPKNLADRLYAVKRVPQTASTADTAEQTDSASQKNKYTQDDIRILSSLHAQLIRIVSPATPRTITLLDNEKRHAGLFFFLGPVKLVRQLSILAIICLVLLIFIAASNEVNLTNINKGFFDSEGITLLMNQTFLLCCAGLGALFSGLFKASKFVTMGTYDPIYDSSYWSSFILGLMAGLIVVELVPTEMFLNDTAMQESMNTNTTHNFGKPIMALIGGFSADLLYRILNRVVHSIDHFLKGDRSAIEMAENKAALSELSEQNLQLHTEQAAKIIKLQMELDGVGDIDTVKKKLAAYASDMLPENQGTGPSQ